ncbi:MAG: hypothetical protein U1E60_09140 [Reyranellaceae bacterium]
MAQADFVGFVADSAYATLVMSALVVLVVAGLSGLLAMAQRRRQAHGDGGGHAPSRRSRRARAPSSNWRAPTARPTARRIRAWRAPWRSPPPLAPPSGSRCGSSTSTAPRCSARIATIRRRTTIPAAWSCTATRCPTCSPALGNGEPIDAEDASQGRTADLFIAYLKPLKTTSVYVVPILSRAA